MEDYSACSVEFLRFHECVNHCDRWESKYNNILGTFILHSYQTCISNGGNTLK